MLQRFLLGLSTLLLTPAVWAQFGSGFQGTIVDRSGGIIPAVAIRVINTDTGVTREVISSANGVLRRSQPQSRQLQDSGSQTGIRERHTRFPGPSAGRSPES
jgi:hypothetical protein